MSGESIRLFVAVYPPAEVAAAMIGSLAGLELPPMRLTPHDQVHLTLQFIGERTQRELPEVHESVERSAAGLAVFALAPLRLVSLPERGPARLIACETDGPPPLLEIHRRLALRLARSPRERSGDRFLPHLTLARFSSPSQVRVALPVEVPEFAVTSISLRRSILKPGGAVHAELARFPLA